MNFKKDNNFARSFLSEYKNCITTSYFYGILWDQKSVLSILWEKELNRPHLLNNFKEGRLSNQSNHTWSYNLLSTFSFPQSDCHPPLLIQMLFMYFYSTKFSIFTIHNFIIIIQISITFIWKTIEQFISHLFEDITIKEYIGMNMANSLNDISHYELVF